MLLDNLAVPDQNWLESLEFSTHSLSKSQMNHAHKRGPMLQGWPENIEHNSARLFNYYRKHVTGEPIFVRSWEMEHGVLHAKSFPRSDLFVREIVTES